MFTPGLFKFKLNLNKKQKTKEWNTKVSSCIILEERNACPARIFCSFKSRAGGQNLASKCGECELVGSRLTKCFFQRHFIAMLCWFDANLHRHALRTILFATSYSNVYPLWDYADILTENKGLLIKKKMCALIVERLLLLL